MSMKGKASACMPVNFALGIMQLTQVHLSFELTQVVFWMYFEDYELKLQLFIIFLKNVTKGYIYSISLHTEYLQTNILMLPMC